MKGKKIILAVSGSIAAYKSVLLLRLLIKAGAEVKVIMTSSAADFVQPLTFATLSKNTVSWDVSDGNQWNNHVELGLWADAMIIAPCTANTLAKMSNGITDNMLLAVYLSARCPIFISPAMDVDMWKHPSTQRNITQLKADGNYLLPVSFGELASGLIGEGRMAEPEAIFSYLFDFFSQGQQLKGQRVLITAGPTHEPIDPVRFIGNRSTGKMGFAIADACANEGAEVDLVLGPTSHQYSGNSKVNIISVQTAEEMFQRATELYAKANVGILAAAVADFRPINQSDIKIKKKVGQDKLSLDLTKTKDIAAYLGTVKSTNQLLVGFALETNNEQQNAAQKLKKKNFDFIVLNSLKDKGAGFGYDTNKVSFLFRNNNIQHFELKSKTAVSQDIVKAIIDLQNQ